MDQTLRFFCRDAVHSVSMGLRRYDNPTPF